MYAWIKLTKKYRSSTFPWELEQKVESYYLVFLNYMLMMVIEYNNNKPTQSNLVSLNQHSIISWKLKLIKWAYLSSEMHYFVSIQTLLFFTVLNSKYETKEKCHYLKTSNISCDLFFHC